MSRALVIGRFQPPHLGHLHAIERAAQRHAEVAVVIGSAQASYTLENPFTAGERLEMLRAALHERGLGNAVIVPLADLHRHAEWAAYVASHVPPFDEVVTNNPLTKLLFAAAGYKVRTEPMFERKRLNATQVRRRMAAGEAVDDAVPKSVLRILRRIRGSQRLRTLGSTDLETKSPRRR